MKKLISLLLLISTMVVDAQNPLMLKDVFPGNNSGTIQQIIKTTNYTFFNEDDDDADVYPSLFRTDGTAAGTIKLDLTYPGYNNSKATILAKLGDKVVFTGDNFAPNNSVIWVSDGTQAGTIPLEQFNPTATAGGGPVYQLEPMNGYVYYTVVANNNKLQLRRTDGTVAGTSLVYEFSGYAGTAPEGAWMKVINGMLYFLLYDQWGTGYDAIWRSDGTAAGTILLRDLGTEYFGMGYFMSAGSKVCFMTGKTANNNSVLFVTDGTAAGTVPMYEFNSVYSTNLYPAFANIGSTLYFAANDGVNGKELWKTDGTAAGTLLAAEIVPGSGSSNPVFLTALNNTLYFNAFTPANGSELWKFDGSAASMVKDINPGSNGSGPAGLTVSENTIIFSSNNGTNGGELWITDGTALNTVMVADINPSGNSVPNTFTPGNPVYFAANNGTNGFEVYKYNNDESVLAGPKTFYVNDNSQAGDIYTLAVGNDNNNGSAAFPLATIGAAFDKAQAGDTIFVDAGNHISSGNISKSITVLGPNYQISPNDATDPLQLNAGRNAEAVISGGAYNIAASNINFKGFTFNMAATAQFQQINNTVGFSQIEISYNRFIINSYTIPIGITGKNITPLSTFNYNISNNRFEKNNGFNNSTSILLNGINGVFVSGNSFVNSSASFDRKQTGMNFGSTVKVDNLTISGNHFNAPYLAITTSRIGNTVIENNKVYNCNTGFSLYSNIPEPATFMVRNNLIQNSRGNAILSQRSGGTDPSGVNKMTIQDNTISIDGTGLSNGSMIILSTSASVLNAEAIVKRNTLSFTGDYSLWTNSSPFGIRPSGVFNVITIDSNEVSFTGVNLSPGAGGPNFPGGTAILISSNSGSSTISLPANAVLNINANKISGFKQSVVFFHAMNGQFGGLANGILANMNNNSFTGDSISINNGTTSQTINANCNWYGAAAAQNVLQKITPTTVNYSPWLINGTDNDPAIGFQPVPGSCNGTTVTVTLTQATNIYCYGQNTGAIDVTVSGGLAPYTFAWTKTGDAGYNAATEDISNLSAGTYHLSLTDANGSTASLDVTLTEPAAALAINLAGTNISCFGANNGSIVANVSGGTTPYTYAWSNGANTATISALAAGAYTVVVTDANGCIVNDGYYVTEPALLTVTMSGTTASCNGSATATAAGGTTPYTYLWNNGATTQTISNVPAGAYSVVVTDANGCTVNGAYTITGGSTINPTTTIIPVSCYGTATGSITVNTAGGVAPHTYNINAGAWQTSNVFSNLLAGTYVVGVKDANGCSDFVTRTVTQPALLTVVLDNTIRPCGTSNNGRIFITVSGGSGAKTYNWTGPGGYTSNAQDPNNLYAGIYNLTVTDTKGCTANLEVNLESYPQINITEVVTPVSCRGGANGAIDATITGGSGLGFTYLWTSGGGFNETAEDISNLKAANYTLKVTDNDNGCIVSKIINVSQPAANLKLTLTKTNVNGCISLGTITAIASGGTAPYEYSLDDISYQSSGLFANVSGGTYNVYTKDARGCTTTKTITVVDNGTDQYEGNNNKSHAKTINVTEIIAARLAVATDLADWFKFTTDGAGNYIISVTHPSVNYNFDLYVTAGNTPALVPVNTTATSKEYVLAANTSYSIGISTNTLSFTCYQLSVNPPTTFAETGKNGLNEKGVAAKTIQVTETLRSNAYPNPHRGDFTLQVNSPVSGMATVQLITAEGKLLKATNMMLTKGNSNKITFNNIREAILLYRVIVGNYSVTGKIIRQN
ncbi:MAG: T9SS type A sorting domain-containing protein [Ferruginibacter sp.]|nr:T9SS type A sorting domain-containing protein [Ferruginibacter sp.]